MGTGLWVIVAKWKLKRSRVVGQNIYSQRRQQERRMVLSRLIGFWWWQKEWSSEEWLKRRTEQGEQQILYNGSGARKRIRHCNRREHWVVVTQFHCGLWSNCNCGKLLNGILDVRKMTEQWTVARAGHCIITEEGLQSCELIEHSAGMQSNGSANADVDSFRDQRIGMMPWSEFPLYSRGYVEYPVLL
jgi:hypothetical protein